jgi:hypothetical protein
MTVVANSSLALAGFPAVPVVQQVSGDNKSNSRNQESNLIFMECLFEKKEDDPQAKKNGRN